MIYVASDVHGLYDRYDKLLETINLREEDTLYLLGDVIDRGPDGIMILQDIMKHKNIVMFLGNHEHMMLMHLADFDIRSWIMPNNGGLVTLNDFKGLTRQERDEILDYLNESYIVKNLRINDKRFQLSHIGVFRDIENRKTKDISLRSSQDMVWGQYMYDPGNIRSFPPELCPTTFISGHIITRRYRNIFFDDDSIYERTFSNGCRYIDIDCGCALGRGAGYLACLSINEEGEVSEPIYIR